MLKYNYRLNLETETKMETRREGCGTARPMESKIGYCGTGRIYCSRSRENNTYSVLPNRIVRYIFIHYDAACTVPKMREG